MKTKLILAASAAATLVSAGAYAQNAAPQNSQGARPAMNHTMTRAQTLAMAGQMFAKMDVNSDGVINQADRAARQAQRFTKLDTDKNGTISQEEFAARRGARAGADAGQGHEGHDMSGKRGGRGGKMGGHGMRGMAMLKLADANNDGSITRAEFDAGVAKHFATVDTNNDGSITPAERQAAHAKMRAARPAGQ